MVGLRTILFTGLLASTGLVSADCSKGLHIFVARGSGEPMDDSKSETNVTKTSGLGKTYGLGGSGNLLKPIFDQINGSDYTAIPYPATMSDPSYFGSVSQGTLLVREAMSKYAEKCPDSKMAFIGYSQGAHIISNNLCGMPPVWTVYALAPWAIQKPVEHDVSKNVVAIVLMGDPTSTNGTSYQRGTHNNTGHGIFYREDSSECESYGDRIRSYCDAGDPFCDVGQNQDLNIHGQYINNYKDEIVKYVIDQYKKETGNNDTSTKNESVTRSDSKDEAKNSSDEAKSGHKNAAAGLRATWGFVALASLATYIVL